MKNTSGYIFRSILLLGIILLFPYHGHAQDTLRTYGPRIGIDLARFAYIFAKPSEVGAAFSADMEIYENIYPVLELGYNSISEQTELFDYTSGGTFLRLGADYNLLPVTDRSLHHSITVGFRYGITAFSHHADQILITDDYWGNMVLESYGNNLTGHWLELVGGVKTEVLSNFFLGWSVRYKILITNHLDPLITPQLIPGYGRGTADRAFGFTYSMFYKIPLFKK